MVSRVVRWSAVVAAAVVMASVLPTALPARDVAVRPWVVWKLSLNWTRSGQVVTTTDAGVTCSTPVHLAARAAFFAARPPQPASRKIAFGTNPRSLRSGARGYNPATVTAPGTSTLVIGQTTCDGGPPPSNCAGTFRTRLRLFQIFTARAAETQRLSMNFAYQAPALPIPRPPCLRSGGDRHVMSIFEVLFMPGGSLHARVPLDRRKLLGNKRYTTTERYERFPSPHCCVSLVIRATFVRAL